LQPSFLAVPKTIFVLTKTLLDVLPLYLKLKNLLVNIALTPILSGAAYVTMGQVVTYDTANTSGNSYTWNASHGNHELCFPNRNCLTITWDFPCGIINPGYVRVTETNLTSGCSTTVTKWVSIAP
jgi:hypothetical protein